MCTALLHKAIGPERVVAIHIDNGFLRKNESEQVKESLEGIGLKLKGKLLYFFTRLFETIFSFSRFWKEIFFNGRKLIKTLDKLVVV